MIKKIAGQRLTTSPGERPEWGVQTGPPRRQFRVLPHADRFGGLIQPDLRNQRDRTELGAGPDDLQRRQSGPGSADHDGPPGHDPGASSDPAHHRTGLPEALVPRVSSVPWPETAYPEPPWIDGQEWHVARV